MTYNFCTYFDSNYLLKGLALYESLIRNVPDFRLYILCMDDRTYEILTKLKLEKVELIKLVEFEDQELLKIKSERKISEYCWTCTPSLPLYILKHHSGIDSITYLDADLYFFESPQKIFEEFGDKSIMIIPHNFSEDQRYREKTSGKYNVGMIIFKNDPNALECLNWWREQCLRWCFDYYEDGKLGDQLYLNKWPEQFNNVCILSNLGADVASWNIKRFSLSSFDSENKEGILLKDSETNLDFPLIFYHFHGIQIYDIFGKIKIISNIPIESEMYNSIYIKYAISIKEAKSLVEKNIRESFKTGTNSGIKYAKIYFKKALLMPYKWLKLKF